MQTSGSLTALLAIFIAAVIDLIAAAHAADESADVPRDRINCTYMRITCHTESSSVIFIIILQKYSKRCTSALPHSCTTDSFIFSTWVTVKLPTSAHTAHTKIENMSEIGALFKSTCISISSLDRL